MVPEPRSDTQDCKQHAKPPSLKVNWTLPARCPRCTRGSRQRNCPAAVSRPCWVTADGGCPDLRNSAAAVDGRAVWVGARLSARGHRPEQSCASPACHAPSFDDVRWPQLLCPRAPAVHDPLAKQNENSLHPQRKPTSTPVSPRAPTLSINTRSWARCAYGSHRESGSPAMRKADRPLQLPPGTWVPNSASTRGCGASGAEDLQTIRWSRRSNPQDQTVPRCRRVRHHSATSAPARPSLAVTAWVEACAVCEPAQPAGTGPTYHPLPHPTPPPAAMPRPLPESSLPR